MYGLLFLISYAIGIAAIYVPEAAVLYYLLGVVLFTVCCLNLPGVRFSPFVVEPLLLALSSSLLLQLLGVLPTGTGIHLLFLVGYLLILSSVQTTDATDYQEKRSVELIAEKIVIPLLLPLGLSFLALLVFKGNEYGVVFFLLTYFLVLTQIIRERITVGYAVLFIGLQIPATWYALSYLPGLSIKEFLFFYAIIGVFAIIRRKGTLPLSYTHSKTT